MPRLPGLVPVFPTVQAEGHCSQHYFVHLKSVLREGFKVWDKFLATYDGRLLFMDSPITNRDLELYTDASGAHGLWHIYRGNGARTDDQTNGGLLELFPILVPTKIWGEGLSNQRVRFMCDNLGVVQVVNRQSANYPPVVRLLRHLVLKGLEFNAQFTAIHLPGVCNLIADSLSRFQGERFQELAPRADTKGILCPARLWNLV